MKKTKAKDILFDNEIQLSSSMTKYSLIKYFDILIALLGVLGVTYVFISSFNIEVNNVLITGCIVCSVLFFSFVFKKSELFKYTLASTLVVFGISIFVFYRRLYDGFILTSSLAMQAQKKDSTLSVFYNDSFLLKNNGLSITIFFAVIIFLISALICFSIIYKPSFILFFLLSVPILELGLYFEVMPSYLSIIMLIVSWASVLGMGTIKNKKIINKFRNNQKREKHIFFSNKTNRSIMTKVGTIIGFITGLIILLTLIICPPSSYKCPDNISQINLSVQAFIENLNYENFTDDLRGVAKGGVNGGKLGTVDKIKYKNETALEVTTPWLGNNIYLKGFIGCEYTGNSWEDIDDKTFSSYLKDNTSINGFNVNAAMLSMLDYSKIDTDKNYSADISISNINANKKFVYMPYSVRSANDNFSDDRILNKKETSLYFENNETKYGFSFYPNSPNVNSFENIKNEINTQLNNNIDTKIAGQKSIQNLSISEQKYTEFVNYEYTKLPEKGLEEIKNKYSGRYNENKDLNGCINETKAAVTDGTTYDLAPGKLPRGKDFVEYFLYENKKGYCTHYASAAAVILRAMGVPTRYVEGYVINKNDAKNANSTLQNGMVKNKFTILDEEEALKTFKISKEQYEKQSEYSSVYTNDVEYSSVEFKIMEIKDTNAHAWIEVYVDKLGWIPIDVTPISSDDCANIGNETTSINLSNTSDNTAVNTSEEASENKPAEQTETIIPEGTITSNAVKAKSEITIVNKILFVTLIFISILILILVVVIIRHNAIINRREKSFSKQNYNKTVHSIYNYLVEIFEYEKISNKENIQIRAYIELIESRYSFINKGEFLEITDIIFKADFSEHKISVEELEKVQNFANKFNNQVYNSLSKIKKIHYTYLKNLRK